MEQGLAEIDRLTAKVRAGTGGRTSRKKKASALPGLRVVLDTNVLVSGLAYPGSVPGRIVTAWRQGAMDVVLSRYLLDELARVLPRLNHRLKWQPADFADLIDILAIEADIVEPVAVSDSSARDAKDLPVLGTFSLPRRTTSSPATMICSPSGTATQS